MRLVPGDNQISITLKKVSSGDTSSGSSGSSGSNTSGDNTGKTDSGDTGKTDSGGTTGGNTSGDNTGSSETGKTDSGGNTDSGNTGKTDTGGSSGGQSSTDDDSSTSSGGSTSGGNTDSGGTSGSGGQSSTGDGSGGTSGDSGSDTSGGDTSGGQSSSGGGDSGSSGSDTSGRDTGSGNTGGSGSGSSGDGSSSSDTGGSSSSGGTTGGQTSSTGTITLSAPEEKSNNSITVTATITGNDNIQDVYLIKGEVEESNIESIFTYSNAYPADQDSSDNTKWTFTITAENEEANDTYTVAAKDTSGNVISEKITIANFDFTAPAAIDESTITGTYEKTAGTITLSWTNPTDADFDHVKITYTSTKQGTESSASTAEEVTETSTTFSNIDGDNSYYTFTLVTVDTLGNGNESDAVTYKVTVNNFVKIDAKSITGTETWTPESSVFVSKRALELSSFYICDHEVTKTEFKAVMRTDPSTATTSGTADNNPVTDVSWYAAIAYCNKLSVNENLDPCYEVEGITDWSSFEYSSIPTSETTDTDLIAKWDNTTYNSSKNGYRLPTEAEWEWAARGGQTTVYAGSDTAGDTTWYSESNTTTSSDGPTHEVMGKKTNGYYLYDMCGNVTEWCWDWYIETIESSTDSNGGTSDSGAHVIRGGSWYDSESDCTVASRGQLDPLYSCTNTTGFRVVRNAK